MQVLEFSPIKESRRTCRIEREGIFYFNMEKELIATFMMIVIASLFIGATLKKKTWKKRLKEKLQKSLRNITGTWTTIGKGTLKKKKVNRRSVVSNNFVSLVFHYVEFRSYHQRRKKD